jgi:SNF2 family DNA or RNA helicase
VEPDLPERVEQTLSIELRPAEKRRYQELHRQLRREYSRAVAGLGLERSTPMLLTGLLRLRQAACHQGLIDRSKQGAVSSKLEVLLERLGELESEGAKALVFSQFTQHLDIVGRHLTDAGIRYVRLDGKTTNRAARVKTFQEDPRVTAFLISLKAGGSGLNLTAAEYVFLLDPWWNPAVEAQAIDRCHRIGQSASVVAYRLIAAGTIEEKVAELQHRKRVLSQSVFDNEAAFWGKLTRDDLAKLLE